MLSNNQGVPIKIVGFDIGTGSENIDVLSLRVLPLPVEAEEVEMVGGWPAYPPTPGPQSPAEQFEQTVPASGYEVAPVGKGPNSVELVIGLKRINNSTPAVLTYLDVSYEYDGVIYDVATPTIVAITDNDHDCPESAD